MKATVKRWGNSSAVRIPASVMQAARLGQDDAVEIREEAGRIVIEPVRHRTYDLSALVKGITRKNRHKSVESDPAMGVEAW